MNKTAALAGLCLLLLAGAAPATPLLGSAQRFAILAHEAVSNGHAAPNPSTRIYGDLGVSPGSAVSGFYPDGTVSGGSIHVNDGVAIAALADAQTAYTTLAGLPADVNLSGHVLGSAGYTLLTPGVYRFDSEAQLNGALLLDFLGDPDARFVFQIASMFTAASGSSVTALNAGPGSGIFWQVGSSATLGADSDLAGNILALASVSFDARARLLCGRAFGLNGAVTLIDNLVSRDCLAEDFGSGRDDGGSGGFGGDAAPVALPEPAGLALLGLALLALGGRRSVSVR